MVKKQTEIPPQRGLVRGPDMIRRLPLIRVSDDQTSDDQGGAIVSGISLVRFTPL